MQRLSRLPGLQRLSRLSTLRRWQDDSDLKAGNEESLSILGLLGLACASIGVIYGDIGTSPLYVYSTVFQNPPTPDDVLGAASLVFWSITLVVLVKYVGIVMLADDNGEGGTFALYATICRACGIPAPNAPLLPSDSEILHYKRVGPGDSGSVHTVEPSTSGDHMASSSNAQRGLLPISTIKEGVPDATLSSTAPGVAAAGPAAATAKSARAPRRVSVVGAWMTSTLAHHHLAQRALLGVTLVMTSMVLADGVLTPSISVLSAVSGLQTKAGLTQEVVIGITCVILVILFAIQFRGTQDIGVLFAPIVLLWFLSNVVVAIYNIVHFEGGAIFRALSPHYIVSWFDRRGSEGWERLAGIFLCLTGCEAMFADMGHFSRSAIQLSFGVVVYPSLIITYLGQASWLLHNLDGYSAVFYNCVPQPVFWPMFIISVLASVVASQALISGSFSITAQSIAMGCFPRVTIKHTSGKVGGQVYIPEVNYALLVLCIAVVAGFRSATAIGNAYGIAVNMVMLTTVFLVTIVILVAWHLPLIWALLFFLPLALIEGTFLSANLLNIPNGGWFSIVLALALSCLSVLWIWGSAQKAAAFKKDTFKLSDVLTARPRGSNAGTESGEVSPVLASHSWQLYRRSTMAPVHRNPGMALVYSASPFQLPPVYRRIVQSWGLHTVVVFVTVRQVPIPHVTPEQRLLLAPLEYKGFFKCVARYGYTDDIDQGEAFAQSILQKIMVQAGDMLPTVMGLNTSVAATAPAATENLSSNESSTLTTPITTGDATTSALTHAAAAAADPAATAGMLTAADPATAVVTIHTEPNMSKLAADAVYVLHRCVVQARPGSNWLRAFLLEKCYAGLWMFTSRFWEGWKLPGARLFEVGLVVEL